MIFIIDNYIKNAVINRHIYMCGRTSLIYECPQTLPPPSEGCGNARLQNNMLAWLEILYGHHHLQYFLQFANQLVGALWYLFDKIWEYCAI